MDFHDLKKLLDQPGTGHAMHELMARLYPICRSITGDGVRQTLHILKGYLPIETTEIPSGMQVFDWTIPLEWNIRDAYIADVQGRRVVDFKANNLHVVSYSRPLKGRIPLQELRDHLHTLPDHPDWIPYRTTYYKEAWGFCVSHRQYEALQDAEYDVCIDATLGKGHLTYGELCLPGRTDEEVLISCHVCHPSLCNDNLSGIAVATFLAQALTQVSRKYSYRFLFIPGTIGSIAWLASNQHRVSRIRHGLVLTGVGDPGHVTYKKSRQGNAEIDRAMQHVLTVSGQKHEVIEFFPYGYDERQYCSPGFNLPVGCFMRTPHGQYPQYHTSADNSDFVRPSSLHESLGTCLTAFCVLENNGTYFSQNQMCEPQLGKRGLYKNVGGQKEGALNEMALLWTLNLSDGQHSLLAIAERSRITFEAICSAAQALASHGLLREKVAPFVTQ
jgi:aminopeptidase-like protein